MFANVLVGISRYGSMAPVGKGDRMVGLLEFAARFGTEERCIEHLAGLRWPGGFVCAECGGRQVWRLKARPRVYECTTCHWQESVTAGRCCIGRGRISRSGLLPPT